MMKQFSFLSLLLSAQLAFAQTLFVDTMQYAPANIVMDFFNGTCVDVTFVEYDGQPGQMAFFEGSQSGLGVNAGIILATGHAQVAVGPNNNLGASAGYGIATPDPLLASIANGDVFDLSMLYLRIVPHTDSIGFQYVFASEEYCEYVNSIYNDAFGFWVKGPGVSNPDGSPRNIALVPGTQTPVAINNVNHLVNSAYYVHNSPDPTPVCWPPSPPPAPPSISTEAVQFDGFLAVLTASTKVVPEETYEVWIGIGDVGDGVWDSGIFLSIESLCGDSLLGPVAEFKTAVSGNTVKFDNTTRYATAWSWDFGDGSSSNERYPTHAYASLDQPYTVRLVAANWCCFDTAYATVGTSRLQEAEAPQIDIYPTQISDVVVIDPADLSLSGELALTDVSGQILIRQRFSGKTVLQTAGLPKGVYFLNINVLGKKGMVQKLVR